MVKIRLRRIGTKGRPFYRVVVAKSTAGRNGAFVETLGQYDPVVKPTMININEERALYWLLNGAQPTETTAILLNKIGVLDKFLKERPSQKAAYKFLDKRTAAMSVKSVMEAPVAVAETAKAKSEPMVEAPVEESEPVAEVVAESPAAETVEAPAEEASSEAPAQEEASAPEATETSEAPKEA